MDLLRGVMDMTKTSLAPVLALLLGAAPVLAQDFVVQQADAAAPAAAPKADVPASSLPTPTPVKPPAPPAAAAPLSTAPAPKADVPASPLMTPVPVAPVPAPPGPECCPAGGGGPRDWYGPRAATGEGQYFWLSGEYLLWWTKGNHAAPLATAGTPRSEGRLGDPGTAVVLGGDDLQESERSGGEFNVGFWLDDQQTWSLQANFLVLGDHATNAAVSSAQFPVLSRPFFDITRQAERVEPVGFPGAAAGSVSADRTNFFWGVDGDVAANVAWCPWGRVDALAGFRYLDLRESLVVTEASTVGAGAGTVLPALAARQGISFTSEDRFHDVNRFFGGTVGATAEVWHGCWVLNFLGKASFGVEKQQSEVTGAEVVTRRPPGGPHGVLRGGLLAQETNRGAIPREVFAAVPELGVRIGYQVTDHVRLYGGYTFLYFSDVLRPEDQIDPLRGQARGSDFWAQGLDFGMMINY